MCMSTAGAVVRKNIGAPEFQQAEADLGEFVGTHDGRGVSVPTS